MSGKSIDDEFAELQKEIERVTTLPAQGSPNVDAIVAALQAMKVEWDKKVAQRFDRPVWLRRMDEAIALALSKILTAGQTMDRHGNLGFQLEGETVKKLATPVVDAALDGLERAFVDKWVKKPGEPEAQPKKVEASDLGGILSLLLRDKINKKK